MIEHPKEYFALQFEWAKRVAEVLGEALEEVLLTYTTFYLNLDLGRSFDKTNPIWQEYLRGLKDADNPVGWT